MLDSAGIDALSFTMRSGSAESQWVHEMYSKYIKRDHEDGNDLKESGQHGFTGWRTKHCFAGSNGKHDMYETKSSIADEVAAELKAGNVQAHVTRVDWAVTHLMREDAEQYANNLRLKAREAIKETRGRLPSETRLYESPRDGYTLYIQSSDKSIMHRSYNSHARYPDQYKPGTWRHELELHHTRAERSWTQYCNGSSSDLLSRSYVAGFLTLFGIDEPWMYEVEPTRPPGKRTKSDTERRLQWFENTVCPVIGKLLEGGVKQSALIRLLRNAGLHIREEI